MNGHQRWYCKRCGRTFSSSSKSGLAGIPLTFSEGRLTVSEQAKKYGVSVRTIHRNLPKTYTYTVPHKAPREVVLLMDTTYRGRHFGIVVMKDHLVGDVLWFKFIYRRETIADYAEGIEYLRTQGFTINAIVCDGLTGLRNLFSAYKFQLCQFHQVMTIKTKLTARPKLEASRELLLLSKMLCHTDKESFIGALDKWHTKWEMFLKEYNIDANGKKYYVHKNLRSAYHSLKRNMPWLWTWYDYPELHIPNTNNEMEGLNSYLKTILNIHKGMSRERQKILIQELLTAHKPNRQRT